MSRIDATLDIQSRAVNLYTSRPFTISGARRKSRLGNCWSLAHNVLRRPAIWRFVRPGLPVIHVELRSGNLTGRGEGRPSARWGESVNSALSALAASGGDPEALPRDACAARAALESARHDLAAQKAGVPVWKMLGLRRDGPPTSFTISLDDPDAMARAAERDAPRFRVLKLKLGGGDGLDLERARAVRSAVTLPFRVDANEGWLIDEALDVIPQLAQLGVELVEQPLRAGDPAGETLRARSPLPIFVDEDCRSADDVAECAKRAHGVNIKLSKCGGIGEALKCVQAARAYGLRTMIGCMIESSLGIAAAAHIASCFDYADIDSNLLIDDDPFTGLDLVDGMQRPSDAPGLGLSP